MRESNLLRGLIPSENHTKRSNSMDFGYEKIMDFAIDIDKPNLANLVGKVMDKIIEYQTFLSKYTENKARDLQKITK